MTCSTVSSDQECGWHWGGRITTRSPKRRALHSKLIPGILSADLPSISLYRLSPSGSSDQWCGWYWGGRITTQSPKRNASTPSSSKVSSTTAQGPRQCLQGVFIVCTYTKPSQGHFRPLKVPQEDGEVSEELINHQTIGNRADQQVAMRSNESCLHVPEDVTGSKKGP